MSKSRVLAILLDGYEASLGEQMMSEGGLPALAGLRRMAAHLYLDHGAAQRTGLAGEHFATGINPGRADRFSAVSFDPGTYHVRQNGTGIVPFPHYLKARTVVFDPPYFDLSRAPHVQGVVNWGAHDPGVEAHSQPACLESELLDRFGAYPAREFIYGCPWPSPQHSQRMGEQLTRAVEVRTEASLWLLQERLPTWDLAIIAVSEPHSAIEGLWHGVDPSHPLHSFPSSEPAADGLRSVYRAVDRLVARIRAAFPEVDLLVFSPGGMGPNHSDVASMVLLGEVLYRDSFGSPCLNPRQDWTLQSDGIPRLGPDESWSCAVNGQFPPQAKPSPTPGTRWLQPLKAFLPEPWITRMRRTERALRRTQSRLSGSNRPLSVSLHWMPAVHYQPYWPTMRAFALPSFYDGRIRINLRGREMHGFIEPDEYVQECERICAFLRALVDPRTGKEVVEAIEYHALYRDPLHLGPTEADLVVIWKGGPLAIDHPHLGRIGPFPARRTGGHTGPYGMAYISSCGFPQGDYGIRSTFDIVPTLIAMLGEEIPEHLEGSPMQNLPPVSATS